MRQRTPHPTVSTSPTPATARTAAVKLEAAQQALTRFPRRPPRQADREPPAGRGEGRRAARQGPPPAPRPRDFNAHEDLKIRNMSRAPASKPDPATPGGFLPNGVAAKTALNRSISDAGWGVFLTILTAKVASAGREVMAVPPATPPGGAPNAGTPPRRTGAHRRSSHCVSCDHTAHADTVGAINVLRAGLVRRDAAST
ncbi:zinc ribbon domain-containing protein [Streptomyces sp. NPDC002285]